MVLRHVLLIILYVFLIRITVFIIRDLGGKDNNSNVSQKRFMLTGGVRESSGAYLIPENDYLAKKRGKAYPLGEHTLIGRSSENDLIINNKYVSARHAVIYLQNDQYMVRDLESKNGTFLNGSRVRTGTSLADGDVLNFGGVSFRFER